MKEDFLKVFSQTIPFQHPGYYGHVIGLEDQNPCNLYLGGTVTAIKQ